MPARPHNNTPKTVQKKTVRTAAENPPAKLLSGDNPQIAKGYGDEPVQAYIAAVPGWKREVCQQLDALIGRAIPKVQKAVKWNTPHYGPGGEAWLMGYHCTTNYVKVAFFHGAQLDPAPPVASTQKNVRYFHIHEGDAIDKKQFTNWVKQAAALLAEKQ